MRWIFNLPHSTRKIEFPMPDEKTKRRIFNIHTGFSVSCCLAILQCIFLGKMTLAEDVDLEEYVMCKVCHEHS